VSQLPSRKQFLLKEGKIKEAGRGRISGANMAFIEQAYANGQRFSDWEPVKSEKVDAAVNKKAKQPLVKENISTEFRVYWPEDEYNAIEIRKGKRIIRSMREACNNCRASLVQCSCYAYKRTPRIVAFDGRGSVEVSIERIANA